MGSHPQAYIYSGTMKITKTMKRIILLAGVLTGVAAAHIVFGQTEGTITYEIKVNSHRLLPKEREEMKSMIPEFRIHQDQLFFNAEASLYKPVEEEDDEIEHGAVRMRIQRPMNVTYINQIELRRIRLQEFMGRKFLIEDSVKLMAWKFGADTKEILGYPCKQATYFNLERKQTVVAWYATQLRPFLGPEGYNTLPGAVLEVDVNDGERLITAKQIDLRPLKKNELKVPSGGTKTTDEEFRKLMDEQIERMKANGGNIIIRN